MEAELLLYCITAIVSALGVKEIWSIWKTKINLKHQKKLKFETTKDQITSKVIDELKIRIRELETKVDELLEVNKECAIHLARLEERLNLSPKKSQPKKKLKSSPSKTIK